MKKYFYQSGDPQISLLMISVVTPYCSGFEDLFHSAVSTHCFGRGAVSSLYALFWAGGRQQFIRDVLGVVPSAAITREGGRGTVSSNYTDFSEGNREESSRRKISLLTLAVLKYHYLW